MVTRRKLILSGATALLATVLPRHAAAADDPAGILTAIYTGVAKGKGDRRRHDRKSSAGCARQFGRQHHPLRFCPRGRPMEDRRHQGSRRRQPMVGPRPARRFIEVLGFKSKARRSRVRPASLPVIAADGWPGPGRSSANPARAEAHPAARRLHRGRHARPEACRHRSSRR